jgi:hypothetical protein
MGTFIYMLVPIALILLLISRVHDQDGNFTTTMETLSIALILTLPAVRKHRGESGRRTGLSFSDMFAVILFFGIAITIWGRTRFHAAGAKLGYWFRGRASSSR